MFSYLFFLSVYLRSDDFELYITNILKVGFISFGFEVMDMCDPARKWAWLWRCVLEGSSVIGLKSYWSLNQWATGSLA